MTHYLREPLTIRPGRDLTACGVVVDEASGDPTAVDCGRCRRTRAWVRNVRSLPLDGFLRAYGIRGEP